MSKKRSINTIFANPYILNGVVWLFVFLVYQLGWSGLCPPLSDDMMIFMTLSIAISILAGIISFYKGQIEYKPCPSVSVKSVTVWTWILMILFIIEAAASGGIPLMSYLSGKIDLTYKDFGLPVVHVIVVNGLSVLILYLFYARRSIEKTEENREKRKRLLILLLVCYMPFVLMFNRGAIMSNLLGMFLVILMSTKRPFRMLSYMVLGAIGIFFVFGALGNLRMGKKMNDLILKVGDATNEFKSSPIPDEFFWGYLYIATPIANTQNTIDRTKDKIGDSEDMENMVLYEFLPEMITKRITGEDEESNLNKRNKAILLTESLNATSVYGRAFKYLGWTGMWTMFAFIMFFIFINLRMVPLKSKWFVPMLISLDIVIVMNLFDNMFIFMGMIPQLFIIIMIYAYQRQSAKMKKFVWRKRSIR